MFRNQFLLWVLLFWGQAYFEARSYLSIFDLYALNSIKKQSVPPSRIFVQPNYKLKFIAYCSLTQYIKVPKKKCLLQRRIAGKNWTLRHQANGGKTGKWAIDQSLIYDSSGKKPTGAERTSRVKSHDRGWEGMSLGIEIPAKRFRKHAWICCL